MEQNLANYRRNQDNLTDKEKLTLRDLRIVQEMYARGYEFMPIDIYRAHATDFQVIDGKIMPSFASIDGMGEKAAIGLMEEAKKGKFSFPRGSLPEIQGQQDTGGSDGGYGASR